MQKREWQEKREFKTYCKVIDVEENWLIIELKNGMKGYIYIEDFKS